MTKAAIVFPTYLRDKRYIDQIWSRVAHAVWVNCCNSPVDDLEFEDESDVFVVHAAGNNNKS